MSLAGSFATMLRAERASVTLTHGVLARSAPVVVDKWTVERDGDFQVVSGEVTFGPFPDAVDFDGVSLVIAGQSEPVRFAEPGRLPSGTSFVYTLQVRIGRL